MTTFDGILEKLDGIFHTHAAVVRSLGEFFVNRDLTGRIRLIVAEELEDNPHIARSLSALCRDISEALAPHAYPPEQSVIYEADLKEARQGGVCFSYGDTPSFRVIDRLATEGNWSPVMDVARGAPRIVFFSIKGGVGRSTALAVAAWYLARFGKKILILDLDLESPGLSSTLLPEDHRPKYGIVDWLVEDIVNNGDMLIPDMTALSPLSANGEIRVVPAHGGDPGDYISKLGRAWMPKMTEESLGETWGERLERLLRNLERRYTPEVVLLDSRAGIDSVASACITGLGAQSVLLFAIDSDQTWTGYDILFRYWQLTGQEKVIRERLKIVAAMIPELDSAQYFQGLREKAWDAFLTYFYDEVLPGSPGEQNFSFEVDDASAPHYPWAIYWNRGLTAMQSLHAVTQQFDVDRLMLMFPFLKEFGADFEVGHE